MFNSEKVALLVFIIISLLPLFRIGLCWEECRDYRHNYITKKFRSLVKNDEILPSELTLYDLRKSCVSMLLLSG